MRDFVRLFERFWLLDICIEQLEHFAIELIEQEKAKLEMERLQKLREIAEKEKRDMKAAKKVKPWNILRKKIDVAVELT